MAIVNQFMNNKKQKLREPELNRAKTKNLMRYIQEACISLYLSACYYYYLEIIIDTDTLVYDSQLKV